MFVAEKIKKNFESRSGGKFFTDCKATAEYGRENYVKNHFLKDFHG